jgi:hypothetical protein
VLWFDHAAAHPNTFHLDISSDDPHVLSWPWASLYTQLFQRSCC